MATWSDLEAELSLWQAASETPDFWWRDDDTVSHTASLDRLLNLSAAHNAPIHLAVIPATLQADLAPRLRQAPHAFVLQHGLAHINHEPEGLRASEVGVSRETELQKEDLRVGWEMLQNANLPNLLPGFTPPWNRIGADTVAALPALGYKVLSAGEQRHTKHPVPGLLQVNCHIDPIRWKTGAVFRGTEKTLNHVVEHLHARRTGAADKNEVTGLLTHHLQTDELTWDFTQALMDRLTHNQRTRWHSLAELMTRETDNG